MPAISYDWPATADVSFTSLSHRALGEHFPNSAVRQMEVDTGIIGPATVQPALVRKIREPGMVQGDVAF